MTALRWAAALLAVVGLACIPRTRPTRVEPESVLPLDQRQILGLERLPNLVRDPDSGQWLQPEVLAAYRALRADAAESGWRLVLVSGYRSFAMQRAIWNRKMEALGGDAPGDPSDRIHQVMKFTSIPGVSRHHWGTDLDLGEATVDPPLTIPPRGPTPRMARFYGWLDERAPFYGFCRAYRGGPGAIQDEPWHWSYVRLASVYSRQFKSMGDFVGFDGQAVSGWGWIKTHFAEIKRLQVDSVDPDCDGGREDFSGKSKVPLPAPP